MPRPDSSDADAGTIYADIMKLAAASDYPLSFLSGRFSTVAAYRRAVRAKVFELFHYDPPAVKPRPRVLGRWETPEYVQEKIEFSTTPWFRVPAYVLTPKGGPRRKPAIVDLHSHGGMFVYGKEKVMPLPGAGAGAGKEAPALAAYRRDNYEGRSTSVELCRRGYVVIAIDAFYFGERRTLWAEELAGGAGPPLGRAVPRRTLLAGDPALHGRDPSAYSAAAVRRLNLRAGAGESVLARSLFWAGATWPGIVHWDDIRTVDYLVTRPDVDPERIACLGVSMGADRSLYLAALDDRIRTTVVVGWMSTLRPMIRGHVATHSFVHYLPGLAKFLDLPDVLGAMAPRPLMVQQCIRDGLYPLEGMKAGARKIGAIYQRAGAAEKYVARFYDHPHVFTRGMQEEAFDWVDRWVKG